MKTNETHATSEICIQRLLHQTEDYVRHEPLAAVAAAFGAGVLFKLLPARLVARPLATLAVKLVPSMVLGVGILKAMELCSRHCGTQRGAPPRD